MSGTDQITQDDVDDLMSCADAAARAIVVCVAWGDRKGGKGVADALMLISAAQAALVQVVLQRCTPEDVADILRQGAQIGAGMITAGVLHAVPRGKVS